MNDRIQEIVQHIMNEDFAEASKLTTDYIVELSGDFKKGTDYYNQSKSDRKKKTAGMKSLKGKLANYAKRVKSPNKWDQACAIAFNKKFSSDDETFRYAVGTYQKMGGK